MHAYTYTSDTHITLLLKILARALLLLDFMSHKTSTHSPKQTQYRVQKLLSYVDQAECLCQAHSLPHLQLRLWAMEVELDVHFKLPHLLTCLVALSKIKIMRVTYGSSSVVKALMCAFWQLQGPKTWHMLCSKLTIKCVYQASLIVCLISGLDDNMLIHFIIRHKFFYWKRPDPVFRWGCCKVCAKNLVWGCDGDRGPCADLPK